MNTKENIRIAIRSVRANLLRAVLTLMIIAFGIMALVGILTAEMHKLLADDSTSDFKVEPFSTLYQRSLYQSMRGLTHLR